MEEYSEFLVARPVTYGSLSNYLNVSYANRDLQSKMPVAARVCTMC